MKDAATSFSAVDLKTQLYFVSSSPNVIVGNLMDASLASSLPKPHTEPLSDAEKSGPLLHSPWKLASLSLDMARYGDKYLYEQSATLVTRCRAESLEPVGDTSRCARAIEGLSDLHSCERNALSLFVEGCQ